MEDLKNYIDGIHRAPDSGKWIETIEPATGKAYARVPDSNAQDIDRAVQAAKKAHPDWVRLGAAGRAKMLRRIAAGLEGNLEAFAKAESQDSGKPVSLAKTVDIPRSIQNLEFFADAATQFASEAHLSDSPQSVNYTMRAPLGVVGTISPWNLPLYLFTWKIAPALAAGNCVVAKPSEVTPLTAALFSKLCSDHGLPPGVLNVVHGTGASTGGPMCAHPDVKAISFTGSTATGRTIATTVAGNFKKVSLEMGGKNPNIIWADCNFDEAVETSVRAAFTNQGQICLCGSRIYVEKSLYPKFRDAFVERARKLKVGDPMEASTDQGAITSKMQYDKVLTYIELARKEGGKFLLGGKSASVGGRCAGGWFIEPTILEGLSVDSRVNREEVFGPFVTIAPFESEDQAVVWANSTGYGLAATLWTQDITRAHRVAARLQSGIVWVNTWMLRDLRTPFGGMKESGVGREGGLEAMRFFTEPKNVCVKIGDAR